VAHAFQFAPDVGKQPRVVALPHGDGDQLVGLLLQYRRDLCQIAETVCQAKLKPYERGNRTRFRLNNGRLLAVLDAL
jgi:hypothetical protein